MRYNIRTMVWFGCGNKETTEEPYLKNYEASDNYIRKYSMVKASMMYTNQNCQDCETCNRTMLYPAL
jgi:hypothetical protein